MNRSAVWLLFAGDVVSAAGIGLTQPYLVILLHAKGIPLPAATALTSLLALASLPGNALAGPLADRYGGHRTMTAGLTVTIAGLATLATATAAPVLAGAVAAVGLGWSLTLPAYSALLAALVPASSHPRAFTLQFALFNAGMGAGSAAAAFTTGDLSPLWWAAAATCAVSIATVWLSRARAAPAAADPAADPGYRPVLSDRALWRVLLIAALTAAAGYGVYNAGLPVIAVSAGAPALMSWASVANCLTIVAGLPLALRAGARLRPARLVTIAAAVWSAAWLLCARQPLPPAATLPLAAALMGLGELFLSGSLPAMVNALAPDALRGRYNAALTLSMTTGMWAGPLLAAAATAVDRIWLLFAAAVALLGLATLVTNPLDEWSRSVDH